MANGLKPNPNEAPVVRRIFEWYTSGHGAITICNLLNDQKIPTKRGGTWYVQGVMTILDNPIYKKSIRYGVTNNYAAGKPTQHRGHYLLSGLLRCPACEAKMVGWHLSRKDRLYRYYKCGDFNSKGKSICKGNYVQADAAERDVLARLSQVLPNSVLVSEALERATRE